MYFYFYRITNLINNKFYYGVHSTRDIDDGYMGSGKYILRAINKYGISNFKKEILMFFNNKIDMFSYERKIVTKELVEDKSCYNIKEGGIGGFNLTEDQIKISHEKANAYKRSPEGRKQTSDRIKKFRKDNPEKAELNEKKMRESWKKICLENPERKKEAGRRISKSLNTYWSTGDIEQKKLNQKINSMKSGKMREGQKRLKEEGRFKGYNNPDFLARWKKVYDSKSDIICELLKYSNLPSYFIIYNILNMDVKEFRLVKYLEETKKLPEIISFDTLNRFLKFDNKDNKGHKDGGSKRKIYTNELKYNFVFLFNDFFDQFYKIVNLLEDKTVSDSMIVQGNKKYEISNLYQVIDYMQQIGYISNIRKEEIRVERIIEGKKPFTVRSKKTVFDITHKVNCILVDKEFNTYGIDDNGKPFQKGRFKLQANGKEYSLRCK